MPASTVGFFVAEVDKDLLCGIEVTVGDWETCRGKAVGGGGLMNGRGDCEVGKRNVPSYEDRGEHDAVVLAWRVGEGEEDIISISEGEWPPPLLLLLLPLERGLRCRKVPFVWARKSRAYL